MKEIVKLVSFILLIIGTVGLLVNEFVFDMGRAGTLVFAFLNVIGLAILIITYCITKSGEKKQEDR